MDHIIDNRLNRSLAIHDLGNLVFEKRQRKAIEPQSLPFMQKQLLKKSSSKKKEHSPSSKLRPINMHSASKKKSNDKIQAKKTQQKNKKQKLKKHKAKQQQQSQEIHEQSAEMDSSESHQIQNIPKPKQQKITSLVPKYNKKSEKRIKAEQSQSENVDINTQLRLKDERPKKQVIKKQSKIKEQNPMQQAISHNAQAQKKKRGRPKKVLPIDSHQILNQDLQKNEPQNVAIVVSQIKDQQPENEIEQMVPQYNQIGKTRARKANLKPIIKYKQNDEDIYSDQSFETDKDQRKKKKISKFGKTRAKNNKPYSLNRIFRKEAKKNFPAFQLQVKLGKLSLKEFVMQFGVFDMIHFSLPVQYLQLFPDMPILMEKGFVFLWVQKKETQIGYHLLNRWGYDVIDQIVWIKCNEQQGKVQSEDLQLQKLINETNSQVTNQLFINIKSTCLVGYKCPLGNKAEYRTKVSNNIIFAKVQCGVKKPEEIYEIADLMMPGAKKLEFGGSSQKGWLNLKHHETTLYRCHSCLKQQDLYFLRKSSKKVLCKKCIIQNIKLENEYENKPQTLTVKFNQVEKSKIKDILHSQNFQISCSRCDREYYDIAYQGLVRQQNTQDFMCIDCHQLKIKDESNKEIQLLLLKKNFYNQAQIECSSCHTTTMYQLYFDCSKCKNHKLCKNCFWSASQAKEAQEQNKKISKQIHEWKLKIIKNSPLMRFWCYECKKEMSLPFWCCQTCQSWMWCGKCSRTTNEIHPHYQTDRHNEYLVI